MYDGSEGDTCDLLRQGPQDELALRDADMGNIETLVLDLFVTVEQDVKVYVAGAFIDDLLAAHIALNCLQLVQELQRLQLCLNLGRSSAPSSRRHDEITRTSQAPLRKRSWSLTYMGSVSHRLLVLLTWIPRLSIRLQALSISPTRSPRLPPRAM